MSTTDTKQVLLDLYRSRGTLTPQILLEEARNRDHPLHNRFEWDDTTAAEQWRLAQSADLIRSVRVEFINREGSPRDLRAFQAVRDEPTQKARYEPVEEVLADPVAAEILKRQMRRDWATFEARYRHLIEFEELLQEHVRKTA